MNDKNVVTQSGVTLLRYDNQWQFTFLEEFRDTPLCIQKVARLRVPRKKNHCVRIKKKNCVMQLKSCPIVWTCLTAIIVIFKRTP